MFTKIFILTLAINNLLAELQHMRQEDQNARFNKDVEKVIQVDQEHLNRLHEIVDTFGWPGFQLVGEEGSDCMWLLVQHCDSDLDFQKRCLILLEEAVGKGDASSIHLAYLQDRVLVNEGHQQIYGTQVQIIDGQPVPFPIQNRADLDRKRKEMGLCPFDEYLLIFN